MYMYAILIIVGVFVLAAAVIGFGLAFGVPELLLPALVAAIIGCVLVVAGTEQILWLAIICIVMMVASISALSVKYVRDR